MNFEIGFEKQNKKDDMSQVLGRMYRAYKIYKSHRESHKRGQLKKNFFVVKYVG